MANGAAVLPRTLGKRLGSLPVAFGLLILFIVAYGLNHSWKATLGALFDSIAGVKIPIPAAPDIHPFGFVGKVNAAIEKWFADAQRYSERGVVWGINNAIELPLLLAGTALALGIAVFDLGEWVADYVRKAIAANHGARTDPRIAQLQTDILRDEARLRDLERAKRAGGAAAGAQDWTTLKKGIDDLGGRVKELERAQHGTTHADVHTGAIAHPDVLGVPHWIARRLSRVEKATAGLGAVALVTAALVRMGFKWVKCDAAKSVGRRLNCGSFRFLESLLSLAIDALVITNLCTVTKLLTRVAVEAQPMLLKLTSGVQHLMECQGADAAPPLAFHGVAFPQPEKSVVQL
jgi:hypothetical protein